VCVRCFCLYDVQSAFAVRCMYARIQCVCVCGVCMCGYRALACVIFGMCVSSVVCEVRLRVWCLSVRV